MAKNEMGAPFGLGLAGGIIILVVSLIAGIVLILAAMAAAAMGSLATAMGATGAGMGFGAIAGIAIAALIWGIIVGVMTIIGAMMMRNDKKARIGAILVLIFGILGFFTPGWGIIVGPVLAIIGGALGIAHSKK